MGGRRPAVGGADSPAPDRVAPRSLLTTTLVVTALVGIALRVWILASPLGTADSDEAVVGLMARHFLDGEFSTFYWGQVYGGVVEPTVVAVLFAVTGSSVLALKLVPVALAVAASFLVLAIGRRTIGESGARIATVLSWAAPAVAVWSSTKEYGFYGVLNVAGLTAVLMALRLREQPASRDAAILGLACGLGWYASPQIVYVVVPCLGWLAFVAVRERRADLLRLSWVAAAGAVLGASPWLVANLRSGWASLVPHPAPPTSYPYRLDLVFDTGLPILFGLKVPFNGHWLFHLAVVAYVGALAGLAFVIAFVIFRCRDRNVVVLAVIAAAYPLMVAYPGTSWFMIVPRYLLSLWPILALLVATVISSLKERGQVVSILGLVAMSVFGLFSLMRWSHDNATPETLRAPQLAPVLQVLRQEDVRTAFAEYWVAYRINFETKESVTAASLELNRHTPYQERVKASNQPAYVLLKGSAFDNHLSEGLKDLGISYRRWEAGGFIVYLPDATVLPESIPSQP